MGKLIHSQRQENTQQHQEGERGIEKAGGMSLPDAIHIAKYRREICGTSNLKKTDIKDLLRADRGGGKEKTDVQKG